MQAQKAHSLGVRSEDVRITSSGPVWHAWVPDAERGRRPLTEGDLYSMCQWVALLRRFENEDPEVHIPALLAEAFSISRSEVRRVIAQGGVFLDDEPVSDLDIPLSVLKAHKKLRLGTRLEINLAE